MKITITGGGGLTGGAVAEVLVRRGHHVTVIARRSSPPSTSARIVWGDIRDRKTLASVLPGQDVLLHISGILHGADVAASTAIDRPRRVVVVSSAGIYSAHRKSASQYRLHERAITARRPDAVIVRPTMIYGSARDRNVHHVILLAHRIGVLPLVGGGRSLIQPIHYMDLAAALAGLAEADLVGETMDAGGPEPITLRAAGDVIFRAVGRRPRYVDIPERWAMGLVRVLPHRRLSERLARMTEDRVVDPSRLVDVTGVDLRPFDVGVQEEANALVS
jgi:uncharacterized protein YbjT (DUF2867 family)